MGILGPRRVLAAGRHTRALIGTGSLVALTLALALDLGTAAHAAAAGVPSVLAAEPTPDPEPQPTPGPEPEPVIEPPIVILPPADTQQPPAPVPVLPTRCVGAGTMPVNARPCPVLRAGKRRPLVVVWGDSHAWQQTRGVVAAARDRDLSLTTFEIGTCPPMILRKRESRSPCANLGRAAIEHIRQQARTRRVRVVLGGYWHGYLTGAERPDGTYLSRQAQLFQSGGPRAFARLARMRNVRTIGIGQQPTLGLGITIPALDLPRAQVVPEEARIDRWLATRVDRVVRPTTLLCGPVLCLSSVGDRSVYTDSLHLDPALSDRLTTSYRVALR
jgi:hypothetical protein